MAISGKSCWGKSNRKGRYFSKRKTVSIVGFGLAKCGKFSDVQATGSAVTAILKKAIPIVSKSCDNYHEKVVPAVRKSCDGYHEKAVSTVRKSCLLWAEGQ